jgi:hypothetical protein
MRVLNQITNAATGETTEEWIDLPDVMTETEGQAAAAQVAQQNANVATLQQQAADALVNLRAYRDLASPTNAQTVATVKLLCRVAIGLIRLRLEKFDATD